MYDVRLYKNTGLNAVNTIDNPNRLNDPTLFEFFNVQPLEILQSMNLSSIRVRASWNEIKFVDYAQIGNAQEGYFYYSVSGQYMTSADVAVLPLVPDYVLSAGGLENVDILDGIITRCHVSDDSYGKWNIEDEYLSPSEPLLLDTATLNFSSESTVYIESSLDLGAMASIGSAETFINDQEEGILCPEIHTNLLTTKYELDGNTGTDTMTTVAPLGSFVREGADICRGLGIESAISITASIPDVLVSAEIVEESATPFPDDNIVHFEVPYEEASSPGIVAYLTRTKRGIPRISSGKTWNICSKMEGTFIDSPSTLNYEYATVRNKRVLYGSLNKVGIITTAGNRLESNPEDTRSGDSQITIRSVGDPHLNGCPYHRFKSMNGDSSYGGFWKNAIKGLQWKQIPLMYTKPSGNVLDRVNFNNSRELKDFEYNTSLQGMINNLGKNFDVVNSGTGQSANNASGIGASLAGLLFGGASGAIAGGATGGALGAIGGAVTGAVGGAYTSYTSQTKYDMARNQELTQFAVSQNIVSPDISVTYDGEAYRDFYGESVIVYRYRPTIQDLSRLDRILTMYGYKVNIPAPTLDLNNRQYFNYVQGNISVGGSLPKWWNDGISAQIAGGTRIWHTKPNPAYYDNNPII